MCFFQKNLGKFKKLNLYQRVFQKFFQEKQWKLFFLHLKNFEDNYEKIRFTNYTNNYGTVFLKFLNSKHLQGL